MAQDPNNGTQATEKPVQELDEVIIQVLGNMNKLFYNWSF